MRFRPAGAPDGDARETEARAALSPARPSFSSFSERADPRSSGLPRAGGPVLDRRARLFFRAGRFTGAFSAEKGRDRVLGGPEGRSSVDERPAQEGRRTGKSKGGEGGEGGKPRTIEVACSFPLVVGSERKKGSLTRRLARPWRRNERGLRTRAPTGRRACRRAAARSEPRTRAPRNARVHSTTAGNCVLRSAGRAAEYPMNDPNVPM